MRTDWLDFKGKAVIVTGAAAGIGAATARVFAEQGASVILADRDGTRVAQTAAKVALDTGAQAVPVACDVADDDACASLVEQSLARFGRVDVLVNNAGIIAAGGILDLSADDFDQVMRVNLRAAFILTQLVARSMVEGAVRGSIINMSSLNAQLAIPGQLAYVTSKGGLQQLTKACALGLAEHGVRVNAVGPGSIMTDILKNVMADDAARRMILSRTPAGRIGDAEEVASVVLFLASDMASYITGQTIFPDGGRSALNYVVPVHDE